LIPPYGAYITSHRLIESELMHYREEYPKDMVNFVDSLVFWYNWHSQRGPLISTCGYISYFLSGWYTKPSTAVNASNHTKGHKNPRRSKKNEKENSSRYIPQISSPFFSAIR